MIAGGIALLVHERYAKEETNGSPNATCSVYEYVHSDLIEER